MCKMYPTEQEISEARDKIHEFSMQQFQEVCKGKNCNANKIRPYHSDECIKEHSALLDEYETKDRVELIAKWDQAETV